MAAEEEEGKVTNGRGEKGNKEVEEKENKEVEEREEY